LKTAAFQTGTLTKKKQHMMTNNDIIAIREELEHFEKIKDIVIEKSEDFKDNLRSKTFKGFEKPRRSWIHLCWTLKNRSRATSLNMNLGPRTPDSSNCTTESWVAPQPYPWPKLSNRLLDSSSVANDF
jgi:hypothetical protein